MSNIAIALLGADGFIGSYIVQSCLKSEIPIVKLPRWSGNENDYENVIQKFKLANSDRQIYLVQTAWHSTSNLDYRNSQRNYEWVNNSKTILEICRRLGIIFAGLGSCLEKLSTNHDLYSSCKSEIRSYLQSQTSQIEWIWFQLHYVYSIKEMKPAVLRKAKEAVELGVCFSLETPNDRHDFIEVRDVADALVHSMSAGLRGVIEVGTGRTLEVSYLIKSLFPNLEIVGGMPLEKRASYQGVAETDLLVNSGWAPKFSIS